MGTPLHTGFGQTYPDLHSAFNVIAYTAGGYDVILHADAPGVPTVFYTDQEHISGAPNCTVSAAAGDEDLITIRPKARNHHGLFWIESTSGWTFNDLIFDDPAGTTGTITSYAQLIAFNRVINTIFNRCKFYPNGTTSAGYAIEALRLYSPATYSIYFMDCEFEGVTGNEVTIYYTGSSAYFGNCTFNRFTHIFPLRTFDITIDKCKVTNCSGQMFKEMSAGSCMRDSILSGGTTVAEVTANLTKGFNNNTFHDMSGDAILITGNYTIPEIKNNTFSSITGTAIKCTGASASPAPDYNHFHACGTDSSGLNNAPTNSVAGDPLFTDAAAEDFTFSGASPLRDAGTDLSGAIVAVTDDIESTARPQPAGGSYDIGAYEIASFGWAAGTINAGNGIINGLPLANVGTVNGL